MANITDTYLKADKVMVICDFSPPREGHINTLAEVGELDVDGISVAYNPGKSVRVNAVIAAYAIKEATRKEVLFTLATRDMNKLALQSLLLGAQVLGLENVVVVKGDPFTAKELALTREVADFKTTEMIEAIAGMNQGVDFRGLRLRTPTDFCVGAIFDLGKDLEAEARLVYRKAKAGAQFFLTQSLYNVEAVERFHEVYRKVAGEQLAQPVFYGLQLMEKDSIFFGDVPESMKADLARGRPGLEIGLELLERFVGCGVKGIYLVPPIYKGGVRDYGAARRVLEAWKR